MASDWWSKKLGSATPQVPAPQVQLAQPQSTFQQPVQSQYPPSQQIQMSPRCPGCGSSNYGGTAESRARCYDCGYPIQQSGSGVGAGIVSGKQAQGPTQAAKQVQSGGFNPQTIIGHI